MTVSGPVLFTFARELARLMGSKEGVAAVWFASLSVALAESTRWARVFTVTTLFPETDEAFSDCTWVREETEKLDPRVW